MAEELEQTYARLDSLVKSESARADVVDDKLHQATIDIAKEKTLYVEKIALGSGAIVAAIVSFLGSHNAKLHPGWLLRSALVLLILAMAGAMYRNWRYPFYEYAFHMRLNAEAVLRRDTAKAQFIAVFPVKDIETGGLLDQAEYLKNHHIAAELMRSNITKLLKKEDWIMGEVKYVELASLLFAALALGMLVALAWVNF